MTAATPELADCDPNSSQILARLQAGGMQQLTELFMTLRAHLRNMIEVRLDRRLHARVDASDIVQETFVRASRNLETYLAAPGMHPVVWLRLIGKHILAETHRRNFRERRSPAREQNWEHDPDDPLVNRLADSMQSVRSAVEHRELVLSVRDKLKLLSESDREMLEMRHVEGLTLEEAAVSLEIQLEAAKKRYQRALKRFREIAGPPQAT